MKMITLSAGFLPYLIGLMAGGSSAGQKTISARITGEKYKGMPKGCSVFEIDGIKVVALNRSNAIRKAHKLMKNG